MKASLALLSLLTAFTSHSLKSPAVPPTVVQIQANTKNDDRPVSLMNSDGKLLEKEMAAHSSILAWKMPQIT